MAMQPWLASDAMPGNEDEFLREFFARIDGAGPHGATAGGDLSTTRLRSLRADLFQCNLASEEAATAGDRPSPGRVDNGCAESGAP